MDPDDFFANFWETLFSPSPTDEVNDLNEVENSEEQLGKFNI